MIMKTQGASTFFNKTKKKRDIGNYVDVGLFGLIWSYWTDSGKEQV